jgi:hypothetical protein
MVIAPFHNLNYCLNNMKWNVNLNKIYWTIVYFLMSLQKMDHSVGQLHLEDNIYALESLLWYIMPASTCNEHAHNVATATAVVVVHGAARHLSAACRYQNQIELEAKTPAWSENSLVCSTWTLFLAPFPIYARDLCWNLYWKLLLRAPGLAEYES